MEIKIETGIDLPKNSKWPFDQLNIGDSFIFPIEKIASMRTNSSLLDKRYNPIRKFICRKIDNTTGRIWRIE